MIGLDRLMKQPGVIADFVRRDVQALPTPLGADGVAMAAHIDAVGPDGDRGQG